MKAKVIKQTRIHGEKVYPGEPVEVTELEFKQLKMFLSEIDEKLPVNNKTYALAILMSGNLKTLRRLQDWIRDAPKPEMSLYILDSSKSDDFGQRIKRWLGSKAMHNQFKKIMYKIEKPVFAIKKTDVVADLYNKLIPEITESHFITLEDDTIPPVDGIIRLIEDYTGDVFAIPYPSRHGGLTVSFDDVFTRADFVEGIKEVKAVSGGFTLWDKRYWITLKRERPYKGWDDWLCAQIRQNKGKIFVHGDLRCEHLCK